MAMTACDRLTWQRQLGVGYDGDGSHGDHLGVVFMLTVHGSSSHSLALL